MLHKGRPIRYQTYLDERKKLHDKGYKLDKALDKKQYKEAYVGAKEAGVTNIAKHFASADVSVSKESAKTILDSLRKLKKTDTDMYEALNKALGNPKSMTDIRKRSMRRALLSYAKNRDYSILTKPKAKSDRQATFYLTWEVLGDRDKAEEAYGY